MEHEVEAILKRIGGIGVYHFAIYIMLGLVNMRGAWFVFSAVFEDWTPDHHCTPDIGHTINQSIPWQSNRDGQLILSKCTMYKAPGNDTNNHSINTVPCQNGWTYTWDSANESSIVSEWDLVCDKKYLTTFALTMYMVGAACGSLFLTPFSDWFGRKFLMLVCLWLQVAVGIAISLTKWFWMLAVLRFFTGLFNMTIALCSYILVVEIFDKDTRELPALSLQFFWALGIMTVSAMANFVNNWRYLNLAVSLPQILTIFYIWTLPESLNFLLIKGKVKKAKNIILTFICTNNLPEWHDLDSSLKIFQKSEPILNIDEDDLSKVERQVPSSMEQSKEAHHHNIVSSTVQFTPPSSVFSLFKNGNIRRYSFIMFYLYLVNSLAYFGTTFNTSQLIGNKYLNLALSGLVEIPAYLVCIVCNRRIGRKLPIAVFFSVCAAGNILLIIFDHVKSDSSSYSGESETNPSTVRIGLEMVGKFGITGAYSALYLYGTEIFPTSIRALINVCRNHAIGLCSFYENIGGILAPQIIYAAKTYSQVPMIVYGVMTFFGAILVMSLPETHLVSLPQTIESVEDFRRLPLFRRKPEGQCNFAFETT